MSNTAETSAGDVPDRAGWKRHLFAQTKPLPAYLVALGVGPFDIVDGGTAGSTPTPLRYVTPHGRGAEAAAAREITPAMLRVLEDYFGTPFPFPKLDSVVIPATVNFGAMENAGMITYQSTLMLARPFEDTATFRRRYAGVGAHEMAHQWFGDLVTLAWWDDTWLNEAFATWMAYKVLDAYQPDLAPWRGCAPIAAAAPSMPTASPRRGACTTRCSRRAISGAPSTASPTTRAARSCRCSSNGSAPTASARACATTCASTRAATRPRRISSRR